jgi:glycosyltransferase involved in cell wall biosynthesis
MPRVLHVIDSLDPGGAERDLATTVRGLQPRGFDQAIHLMNKSGPLQRLIPAACPLFHEAGLADVMKSCQVFQPEVIVTWLDDAAVVAAPVAAMCGVPLVHRIPNVPSAQYSVHPKTPQQMREVRHVVQAAAHVCAVSDSAADDAAEYFRIPRPSVVYNGFPLACAPTRQAPRKAAGTLLIAAVGRLAVEKNHRALIAALPAITATHPHVRCWIAGVGPLEAELTEQIGRLGLTRVVTLLGYQEDVRGILEQADLFVMPSLYEGFGNALVEAMVAGVPPVVSDLPVWRGDVLRHGPGACLVPPGDDAALAAAIETLVADEIARRQLGEEALKAGSRFRVSRMIDDYASMLNRVLCAAAT